MSDDAPLVLCYDGSPFAKEAVSQAAALLRGRRAVVLSVWLPGASLPSLAWSGATMAGVDLEELDRQAQAAAQELAEEGARLAFEAGLDAEPATACARGPVWDAIVRTADELDAGVIVLGARGLTGIRHVLLGSVSEGVVRHSMRPTLVIHRGGADGDADG